MIVLVPKIIEADLQAYSAELEGKGIEFEFYTEDGDAPAGLSKAEGLFRWVKGQRYSALVEQAPRLRWLHTASAGVDHVLTPGVLARSEGGGLIVSDSGEAFGPAISEWVLMAMLSAARRWPEQRANQREHRWQAVEGQRELYRATLGIVGLGPIGRAIASDAKAAFRMHVLGLRRTYKTESAVNEILIGPDGLDRLLSESDYVVLAAALTGETRHLIGAEQIARMKPDAWLINIARGAMVDEPALIAALQEGRIGGAALDVFAEEPLPADSPLWDMPNVIISPHNSGGWTEGLRQRQIAGFVKNLILFEQGEPMLSVVDVGRGY